MYLAYLAKQMQIRARVMFDATRLLAEKQDCTEFFTFAHDDEMPFKADDSEANNLLGLAGQVLRTYEVGKLISMGYRQEAIYAVLDQFGTSDLEFPDAIHMVIEKQDPYRHRFVANKVQIGQFRVAEARKCIICGQMESDHTQLNS